MSRATEGFSARTAMVLDSMAFIRSSVYRVPASNRRWQERNTSAQQHWHDAHFDRKVGTCPSSRFYGQVDQRSDMRSHEELAHSSSLRTETLVGRGGIESTAGGRLPSEGGRRIPSIAIAARKHQHAGPLFIFDAGGSGQRRIASTA